MSNDALTTPKTFAMTQPAPTGGTTSGWSAGMLAGLVNPPVNGSLLDSGADSEYRFVSALWFATAPVAR